MISQCRFLPRPTLLDLNPKRPSRLSRTKRRPFSFRRLAVQKRLGVSGKSLPLSTNRADKDKDKDKDKEMEMEMEMFASLKHTVPYQTLNSVRFDSIQFRTLSRHRSIVSRCVISSGKTALSAVGKGGLYDVGMGRAPNWGVRGSDMGPLWRMR